MKSYTITRGDLRLFCAFTSTILRRPEVRLWVKWRVTTSYIFFQSRTHILRNVITKLSPKSRHLQETFTHIWKYYYATLIPTNLMLSNLMLYYKISYSITLIGYNIIFSTKDFGLSYCLLIFLWSCVPSHEHTEDVKQSYVTYIIIYFVSYLSGDDFLLSRNMLH